ncbi:MAG: CPBP family intramembrane metalloprotease [Actinomycetota bacterium]|nr:CPBP family intramembrane metalloprotease [Actinomycetota bacterium]
MELPYSQQGRLGRNSWVRWGAGLLLIAYSWFVLGGAIPPLVAAACGPGARFDAMSGRLVGVSALVNYAALALGFVPLLCGTLLAVRLIHGRRLRTLLASGGRPDARRVFHGFALYGALLGAAALGEVFLGPPRYELTWDPAAFLQFLPVALLLVPLQAGAEELLFRGYLLQGFGLFIRNPIGLASVSGLLFALSHVGNPELDAGFWLVGAYYFGFGALLALVTLRTGGLDLAVGAHSANNLFALLLVNSPDSIVASPSVWTIARIDTAYTLISFLAVAVAFYALTCCGAPPSATAADWETGKTSDLRGPLQGPSCARQQLELLSQASAAAPPS